MSSAAQIDANQKNAQQSTGPKTAEGKAASSQNRTSHGLAATRFSVCTWESQDAFDELAEALHTEYQPSAPTEFLLVEKMAQSWWLRKRAQDNQDATIEQPSFVRASLDLYMRYQSLHDRAFHKALSDLQKIRAERRRAEADQQKAEMKAERDDFALAKKMERESLAIASLRLKIKAQEARLVKKQPAPPSTPAAGIGFVPQPAKSEPQPAPIATAA